MKTYPILSILALLVLLSCQKEQPVSDTKGNLLIIGGGRRPVYVMEKFVDLAGGRDAAIAVIPSASAYAEESGARSVADFSAAGAGIVTVFNIRDSSMAESDSILSLLKEYDGYYFGGGNQNRLTDIFTGTKFLDLLHQRYNDGAVIGGTSAGAAIMSEIMITGDGNWEMLVRDSVITTPGFGFVTDYIIDQHFIARRRLNRLLALCLQYQTNGIGIDESTAIWINPAGHAEVIGESAVVVLRGAAAVYPQMPSDSLLTGKNLLLSVYGPGDRFRL
jgi:cyanophycinase